MPGSSDPQIFQRIISFDDVSMSDIVVDMGLARS